MALLGTYERRILVAMLASATKWGDQKFKRLNEVRLFELTYETRTRREASVSAEEGRASNGIRGIEERKKVHKLQAMSRRTTYFL